MKYFLIAGEASGDLHGAKLMYSLKKLEQEAEFYFFGGDLMLAEGGVLLKHYHEMAFMGGIDVLRNLDKIQSNFRLCRQKLLEIRPDLLILIDYPGFNLKIAEFAHKHQIRVFYYILPKVWAWKEWRINKLRKYVDELFAIFPFEVDYFKKRGITIHYHGNPLTDMVSDARAKHKPRPEFLRENNLPDRPLIALLPGSRNQEIKMILPVMSMLAKDFPGYQFVISGTVAVDKSLYSIYSTDPSIPVLFGKTYELLSFSHAAVVASGTATLETALLNVPQVVLYKMAGGKIGYRIFRFLFLKVKYYSLPNLVLNREFLQEFYMDQMKYTLIKPEADKLLNDDQYRKNILDGYTALRQKMGEKGVCHRVAEDMIQLCRS